MGGQGKLTVSFLKDEHRAESHSLGAACADVDAQGLHRLDEGSGVLGIEGDVCSKFDGC